jgi:hypothetical protein
MNIKDDLDADMDDTQSLYFTFYDKNKKIL